MVLRYSPYQLKLKHVFTIATNSRSYTPTMLVEIEHEGVVGYGEASMPPYLGEDYNTASYFLSTVDLSGFASPFDLEDILCYVDQVAPGNYAAKASIDIALHDLIGKLKGEPVYAMWGLNPAHTIDTTFTIGIDEVEVVKEKAREAASFNMLKIKLGRDNDKEIVSAVKAFSIKPLCVDVNQGWSDKHYALDMIWWLKDHGVVFVEQPLPKSAMEDTAWLTMHSPLPIIADEAIQTPGDMNFIQGVYSGINIKLMKCGGMEAAKTMVRMARSLGLNVMIGCMTETSCAVTAAAQLCPLADWADLDGNLLIDNDPFEGLKIVNGRVKLPNMPGLGIRKVI
jgi:L-alanine-DL-glutamate epimerase-like enolase superfamily enzyme